jgi:secreted PhoX family phosphatase
MSIDHETMPSDAVESIGCNPSDNDSLSRMIEARVSRRTVMAGGLGAAAAAVLGMSAVGMPAAAAPRPAVAPTSRTRSTSRRGGPGFTAIPVGTDDAIVVPAGYTASVILPWGTPLSPTAAAWKKDGTNTAAEQAGQVGMHHDGMHYFPIVSGRSGDRAGVLCINHEYVDTVGLYDTSYTRPIPADKVQKALEAHGVTVCAVKMTGGSWDLVTRSKYNRRITGNTPVTFSGPVGNDHPALQTGSPALGTLNNCANGYTPWGTYLTCEENWNGYFGTNTGGWTPTAAQARYGLSSLGFGYSWHDSVPRFDLAATPNEVNRFGWVVEIDPLKPNSTPVKRTALGRFKHEGATVTEVDGHAVVYSGDDENREYVYKYVSAEPWRRMRARGVSPLDEGTLYVARFDDDGTGRWLPLVHGRGVLRTSRGWVDQADVMLRTREAADAVGATKLDRPEWVAVHPRSGEVYLALTNGSGGTGAASPRANNPYGHIVRWNEVGRGAHTRRFEWDIFVLAGDPNYDPTVQLDPDDIFGSPDGLWFDRDGRLWIQTDVSNGTQNRADRGHDAIGNNQMLVADVETGDIRRFLVGPRGAEITGITSTPDRRTVFINVQHPGESTTYWNGLNGAPSAANPRTVSNWPDFDVAGRPRSATVVIQRVDGGVVGT